jgi:hypothetical protein
MHDTDTPGSEAPSSTPPEPPGSLWGMWRPGQKKWLRSEPDCYRAFASRGEAASHCAVQSIVTVPALLGVSPAVVAQRDKLGKVLETALRYIEDSDLYGSEVAYGVARAALAEWRAAQEREGKGSPADGQ